MLWLVVIIPWLNWRMRKYLVNALIWVGCTHPPGVILRNAFLVCGGWCSVPLERWTKILGGVGECKSIGKGNKGEGRIKATRAESQWIVAARPLCHLQYPVAYLSRLQRILPAVQWKLRFKASRKADPPHEGHPRARAFRGPRPLIAGRQANDGARCRF
ncbi:unnamed protein product [Sphenostylis stenocarpa]|uniref:Secreted protein n=1 Tax=Sphenostylis stenocarpa TaxID=92480 RepID=A0AA86SZ19_9FABA|nr:unnamed protein product [Sphenostylis stenocarpa]